MVGREYDQLWRAINRCERCRDDTRIAEAIRQKWALSAFMPFESKGPEAKGSLYQGQVVRYILLAQEPSSGWARRRTRDELRKAMRADPNLRNFNGSLVDFLVRWAARRWLLRPGEAFYLTDLGKCSVPGKEAELTRARRYNNCRRHLDREIALFGSKRLRAIIPLGEDAYMWALGLAKPDWPEILPPVIHYAARFPQNSNYERDRSYIPEVESVNRFIQNTKPGSSRSLTSRNRRARRLLQIYKLQFSAIRARYRA